MTLSAILRKLAPVGLAVLGFLAVFAGAAEGESYGDSTAAIEVRVWQDVGDGRNIYISARSADGSWRTLGASSLPLDDGLSSTGRYRYGDIASMCRCGRPRWASRCGSGRTFGTT